MRSPLDRLRHALSFEIIALCLVIPLGALAFGKPIGDIGVIGVVGATLATLWNMGFNTLYDRALKHLHGTTLKTPAQRVVHTVLFELGLLAMLLPFIAWYLDISLWQALVMDVSFAAFYMAYAFVFNWAYDALFPLPEWSRPQG
ncbi:PACE efflux transporter [Pseudoroseicyclus sp. H15]